MAADPRPLFNAAIVPANVTVDPDGTLVLSDESDFNPVRDGADDNLGLAPRPAQPPPPRPGYHPDFRARVDGYAAQLPGGAWTVDPQNDPDGLISDLRTRARGVYWDGQPPRNPTAATLFNMNRIAGRGHKLLTPSIQHDVRIIGSATKDNSIANMVPLVVTAKPNLQLTKSDIAYFLRSTGVIEYRIMDALFAAVACIPEVRGPFPIYDYGSAARAQTVALPAITWDHIRRKFQHLEGEGPPPSALPGYMPGFLDPATGQPGDPTNIHPTVQEAHSILLPILLDGDHWVFAYILRRRRTVLIFNSDPRARDAQETYRTVEKYLHYWNLQNLSGDPNFYPDRWHTLHLPGVRLGRISRDLSSGLASVLGALLVICNVNPDQNIGLATSNLRAFFAAALAEGGFRGDYYFPHQDQGNTRTWGTLVNNRGFLATLGRPPIP